jgi:hypothetical protein
MLRSGRMDLVPVPEKNRSCRALSKHENDFFSTLLSTERHNYASSFRPQLLCHSIPSPLVGEG